MEQEDGGDSKAEFLVECLVMPHLHAKVGAHGTTHSCEDEQRRFGDSPQGLLRLELVDAIHEECYDVENQDADPEYLCHDRTNQLRQCNPVIGAPFDKFLLGIGVELGGVSRQDGYLVGIHGFFDETLERVLHTDGSNHAADIQPVGLTKFVGQMGGNSLVVEGRIFVKIHMLALADELHLSSLHPAFQFVEHAVGDERIRRIAHAMRRPGASLFGEGAMVDGMPVEADVDLVVIAQVGVVQILRQSSHPVERTLDGQGAVVHESVLWIDDEESSFHFAEVYPMSERM